MQSVSELDQESLQRTVPPAHSVPIGATKVEKGKILRTRRGVDLWFSVAKIAQLGGLDTEED